MWLCGRAVRALDANSLNTLSLMIGAHLVANLGEPGYHVLERVKSEITAERGE